jgi:HEAT repeat protein
MVERFGGQWFAWMLLVVLCTGCGVEHNAESRPPAKKSSREKPPPSGPAKKVVAADAFASVPAALDHVETLSANGGPSSDDLVKIETWIGMQGTKAAPELAAAVKDPDRHLAARITACRVLARLGAAGEPTLIEASHGEPRQLRLKATESLGRIEPTDARIVKTLAELLDSDDFDQRKAAFTALANVGPPAAQADTDLVPKLMSVLNDTKEDETIRGLAKTALKRVDPRTGLQKAH